MIRLLIILASQHIRKMQDRRIVRYSNLIELFAIISDLPAGRWGGRDIDDFPDNFGDAAALDAHFLCEGFAVPERESGLHLAGMGG